MSYKAVVRSFIYDMVNMKADVVFAVRTIRQFMSTASPPH